VLPLALSFFLVSLPLSLSISLSLVLALFLCLSLSLSPLPSMGWLESKPAINRKISAPRALSVYIYVFFLARSRFLSLSRLDLSISFPLDGLVGKPTGKQPGNPRSSGGRILLSPSLYIFLVSPLTSFSLYIFLVLALSLSLYLSLVSIFLSPLPIDGLVGKHSCFLVSLPLSLSFSLYLSLVLALSLSLAPISLSPLPSMGWLENKPASDREIRAARAGGPRYLLRFLSFSSRAHSLSIYLFLYLSLSSSLSFSVSRSLYLLSPRWAGWKANRQATGKSAQLGRSLFLFIYIHIYLSFSLVLSFCFSRLDLSIPFPFDGLVGKSRKATRKSAQLGRADLAISFALYLSRLAPNFSLSLHLSRYRSLSLPSRSFYLLSPRWVGWKANRVAFFLSRLARIFFLLLS